MLLRYFEHPAYVAIALVAIVVVAALSWRARRVRRARCLVLRIAPCRWPIGRALAVFFAFVSLALAAAGPRTGGTATVATARGFDVAIVIDGSRSMLAKDTMPDRFIRAKE